MHARFSIPVAILGAALLLASRSLAGPLGFLIPAPELQVVTVTDTTEAGAAQIHPTPKAPAYYIMSCVGPRDFGGIIANVKIPEEKEVVAVATKVLAHQGYLAASKEHPANLLLVVTWGTLFVDTQPGETDPLSSQANHDQMMRFLGGYKVGLTAGSRTDPASSVQGEGFQLRDIDSDRLSSIASHNLYVIAVGAYDYRAVTEKKRELLWTTKISAPSKGFTMKEVFASMIEISGPTLGRETVRPVLFDAADQLKGDVKVGEAHVVGDSAPNKPATGNPPPPKSP